MIEVRFYAIGEKIIPHDESDGEMIELDGEEIPLNLYLPETENHQDPSSPTLYEIARQKGNHRLEVDEIKTKFYEVAETEEAKQYSQLCVFCEGTMIAIEGITDDLNSLKPFVWLVHSLSDQIDGLIRRRKNELN